MAEARFCSECGAALLRRFCPVCHAVNEADSHFCQSCGASLPASPAAHAPAPMPPPDSIPSLTDVAFLEPGTPDLVAAVAPPAPAGAVVAVPPQLPSVAMQAVKAPAAEARYLYRMPALLGVGGVAALLVAIAWWPQTEPRVGDTAAAAAGTRATAPAREPAARPAEAAARPSRNAAATTPRAAIGGGAAASPLPVLPEVSAAAQPAPAQASAGGARVDGTNAAAALPAPARSAERPMPRRTPAEVIIAVQPPAAAERRAARPQPKPVPPAPTYECTPQVDALGLCAPGARVTGR